MERQPEYPPEYDQGTPCDYARRTLRSLDYAFCNWDTTLPTPWLSIVLEMKEIIENFIKYAEEMEG